MAISERSVGLRPVSLRLVAREELYAPLTFNLLTPLFLTTEQTQLHRLLFFQIYDFSSGGGGHGGVSELNRPIIRIVFCIIIIIIIILLFI